MPHRVNQKVVLQEDFELAKDKVLMGVARKSMLISEHEKRVTAITKQVTRSSRP
jgi:cell division protease FtsH